MGVDVGGDGDVRVAHQFFGDIDGHARPLEIGAEGVAQDVRGEGGDGDAVALGVAPMDIAEDAVEIDAMQGAGAIEAGK